MEPDSKSGTWREENSENRNTIHMAQKYSDQTNPASILMESTSKRRAAQEVIADMSTDSTLTKESFVHLASC